MVKKCEDVKMLSYMISEMEHDEMQKDNLESTLKAKEQDIKELNCRIREMKCRIADLNYKIAKQKKRRQGKGKKKK